MSTHFPLIDARPVFGSSSSSKLCDEAIRGLDLVDDARTKSGKNGWPCLLPAVVIAKARKNTPSTMAIKIHHLGISQGERILWLCEELNLPYEIIKHTRSPLGAPDSLKNIPGNATGKSPFIEDTDANIGLAESAAICDYLIYTYGNGRLALKPGDKHYHEYLYWFHFANGTQVPTMQDAMFLSLTEGDNIAKQIADQRVHAMLKHADERLQDNKWLAGPEFTAADIMTMYGFTTQRYWGPQVDLAKYPNIVRWIGDCAKRDAYQKAMTKGDPEMVLLTSADAPKVGMFEVGGTNSDHWKKQKGNL